MKYFLLFITGCCFGCGDSAEMIALKESLRITGEVVETKQDESLVILRENTAALSEIKQQVETLNASLVKSEPQREEVIKSALEPQKPTQATPSHTEQPVAVASAVRSSKVKMTWNIEGNWNPSILETARHLREDHGFIADGLSHQQMHDAHAAFHEGRKPVAMRAPPVQIINRGTGCPGGVCPLPQMQTRRRR